MKPIELTHATWKTDLGSPVKVYVYPQHIFAIQYMPNNKATAVQAIAGAYQSVLETESQIIELINNARKSENKEEKINE